ncbi:hydroperoxide isomerase ALOXE3-like [Aegotheles albertisi]
MTPDDPEGTQASGGGGVRYRVETVVAQVTSRWPLGTLLLLRLHKEPLVSIVPDRWLCDSVTVTGPLARTPRGASWEPRLLQQRQEEREERAEAFHQIRVRLRGLGCGGSWRSFGDIEEALGGPGTPISEYVVQHWADDAFFGAQFLRGVNPVLLRRCARLPPNLPLTPPMVAPALGPHTCLHREMEGGRLFVADFAMLEGVPTGHIGGDPQFLAAPICLLWLNPQGDLLPIAIQLSQHPGPNAPIFLPGDGRWCWALAKLWVRGANFTHHEMVTHLLHSHFLGEAFALATHRLPACHPIHQLLLPHCRFTFHINILARDTLLNPGGIIDQATAVGREGTLELVARGTAALTYRELCVPDDLEHRGVTDVPNYHYRDDALEIWEAIKSLVEGIVALYYPEDSDVAEDHELQDWVGEIFTHTVLGNEKSGRGPEVVTEVVMAMVVVTVMVTAVVTAMVVVMVVVMVMVKVVDMAMVMTMVVVMVVVVAMMMVMVVVTLMMMVMVVAMAMAMGMVMVTVMVTLMMMVMVVVMAMVMVMVMVTLMVVVMVAVMAMVMVTSWSHHGFPSKLCSRPELVKFVTMIIFCCSARHAAVNSGQYDYAAWMPNTPATFRRPPPKTKEEATEKLFLETLPSPKATGALLALLSVVSYEGGEPRPLGSRSQELFSGAAPRRLVDAFRRRLAAISHRIQERNRSLDLPYPYLDPASVQESVSI